MLDVFGNRNIALCRELTKKHEEINRGTIAEILDVCDDMKGEMVLVVEGGQEEISDEITFNQTIEEHVEEYIQMGMTTKDAIKEVAKVRKLSKNQVYNDIIKNEYRNIFFFYILAYNTLIKEEDI